MPNSVFKEEPAKEAGRDNLFLWTVFLLLLAALVFACWLGSFYVFGHPEQPRAYRILQRLGKLAPPVRFAITKAPPGEFLEAQRVFERYSKYTALQMQRENELLFRCYLKNYTETKKIVPYLTGKFVILRAYELQRGDLLSSGVVVLTQSADFPQMLAEVVYPTPKESVADVLALLQPGLELRLQRTLDLSAIVQVSHAPDGRLQVSVFPLLYGSYALKNGVGSFSLEPPSLVNVGAGFPLVRGEEVRSVMRENLRRRAIVKAGQPGQAPEQAGEIVRVDEPSQAPQASLGSAGMVSAQEGARSSASTPEKVGADALAGGSSAVISPALNVAGNPTEALPERGIPGEPVARAEPLPKAEPVLKPEQGLKGEPVAKTDQATKAGSLKNSNPAWMSKVVPVVPVVSNPIAANAGPAPVPLSPPVSGPGSKVTADPTPALPAGAGAKTAKILPAQGVAPANGTALVKNPSGTQVSSNGVVPPAPAKLGPRGESPASPEGGRPPAEPLKLAKGPISSQGVPGAAGSATGGVAGKPFLAASPAPSTTQATGSWKTYSGGRSPGGKSVTAEQATSLQGRNDGAPMYLHGRFTVTAAGTNRAVLRQTSAGEGKVQPRVIVEYPAGAVPPQQGASIAREDGRGFEIREVRRTPDGQVNIYVREVSAP